MRIRSREVFLPVRESIVIRVRVSIGRVAVAQAVGDFPSPRNPVAVIVYEKIQREKDFVVRPVDAP